MLLVIVKANLYGDNSFTTNGNFLVSNYGVKYNLLLTVNNIEILFKFKRELHNLSPLNGLTVGYIPTETETAINIINFPRFAAAG